MKIAVFNIFILIVGCSTLVKPSKSPIDLNLDLVRPHSESLYKERDLDPPYVAIFQKNEKTLLYVAAVHEPSVKFNDLLTSPTFSTIRKAFQEYPVDAVIIEGIQPWDGDIPSNLKHHAKECETTGFKINCGESWYAIDLAQKKSVSFFTGEPSELEILNFVESKGYTVKDLFGFYVTRQMPEWKRSGLLSANNSDSLIHELLLSYHKRLQSNVKFDLKDFKAWYASHVPKPANYLDIDTNDVGPYWSPGANYLQKISGLVGIVRDRTIVSRINESFKDHSTVLVVYGASHLLTQNQAFQDSFGPPKNEKWY